MIFDTSSAPHLKPWLVRTLEPICDAEPGALADYILALLKHNVPESEMRNELNVQLDEFLEKECTSFIDTLFTVLRTKSYLPYGASTSSPTFSTKLLDNGIPIPLDGLISPSIPQEPDGRNRKRSMENDERDGRPSAKGPRLEGQFSRYGGNERVDGRPAGGWGGRVERPQNHGYRDGGMDMYGAVMGNMGGMGGIGGVNGMGHMNGRRQQAYQPPDQKRGICRDYHNNGFCARGAMCKYSHGDDAVVPSQLFPMNGQSIPGAALPFLPMFANGGVPFGMAGPPGAYDPHEARMDMRPPSGRPQQRAPLLPRVQQEDGSRVVHPSNSSGELPVIQDLTPSVTKESSSMETESQPQQPQNHPRNLLQPQSLQQGLEGFDGGGYGGVPFSGMHSMNGQPFMQMNHQMEVDMGPPPGNARASQNHRGNSRNGRGRGTFGGEVHNFRPERRTDKTLVVEKIPEDKLTMALISEWFGRFGTVTNVAIDITSAKALVSFSNHEEAHAAWKSEDAVFNNRFVKLFWHRPMDGHGQAGSRALAASAPLVANITSSKEPSHPPTLSTPVAPTSLASTPRKPSTTSSATMSALAAKQQLLEQQIAEQKSLMASLAAASSEEKKDIMARLRKLGEEMTATPITPTSTTPLPSVATKKLANHVDTHEQKERERLDKELEMHSVTGGADGEESAEDLKAKLEKLKAEAASLGISEAGAEPTWSGSYRGYRGRGRGARSFYRGAMRGGPPRPSMKLDNRPKKLLLKGASEEGLQAVRDWYETTGQLESVDRIDGGDLIISFKSRAAAEQGLAKGNNISTVGTVQLSWWSGKPAGTTSVASIAKTPTTVTSLSTTLSNIEPEQPQSPDTSHLQEEEIVASGWGSDGDEGDGMGML